MWEVLAGAGKVIEYARHEGGKMSDQALVVLADDGEFRWQQEILSEVESWRNVHRFILYFNVSDYVVSPSLVKYENFNPLRLREYLGQLLHDRGYSVVIHYSASQGLRLMDESSMRPILASIDMELPDTGRRPVSPISREGAQPSIGVEAALSYLEHLLAYGNDNENEDDEHLRIAVIIEYLETIAPREGSHLFVPPAERVIEFLHRLSFDLRIRRKGHVILMLTEDIGQVASSLQSATSECRIYRVDLPDTPRREAWISWLHKRGVNSLKTNSDFTNAKDLAAQTAGFNYDNLRDLMYIAQQNEEGLTLAQVRERKREVISAESRDLLEFIEPSHNLDDIAGYEWVRRHLRRVRELMKDPDLADLTPKGILFLGPPGTGKSYTVAALAEETKFNMVKFKNIRSMWVGESERNLNRVLDLLTTLHPAIVFIDEIDQALGRRGGQEVDSSGVDRRLFQRLLEVMADDRNRGKVLWVAASNRPDLVDQALISRFDMVVPYLLPDAKARRAMFDEIYPKKLNYQVKWENSKELDEVVHRTSGFSGRELDTICRHAKNQAAVTLKDVSKVVVSGKELIATIDDFRPAHDEDEYMLFTLLAIQATNFSRFLPDWEDLPEDIRKPSPKDQPPVDKVKLQDEIARLTERRARRHYML